LISFTCEKCGKQFQVDEHILGKRGRCLQCGHVMRISSTFAAPPAATAEPAEFQPSAASGPAAEAEAAPFRLSPLEPPPGVSPQMPAPAAEPPALQPTSPRAPILEAAAAPPVKGRHPGKRHPQFELLDDDADPAALLPVAPEIARGLREVAEFEKDRQGYNLAGEPAGFFSRLESSRPASWLYVKWRAGVGFALKLLRWVDSWAYLISVPFLILMLFGIVVANRGFVHTGAVVVVLANYGRFWTDLIALFVRPYKDGPLQGLAFLFPPYTVYYMTAHWDRVKPIVRRIATSCIPIILVVFAYAFLASVNPAAKDVHGVTAKILAGEHELSNEIVSEIRNVESELESLGKTRDSHRNPSR
jgi:hypothetical protein